MKNIINEKPKKHLTGRLKASMDFVSDNDIRDKKILDIGCGFGSCILNLLSRGAKEVTGLELSESDLAPAKENIKDDRVEFITGSAIKLPFEDSSFDTVVSWEVIEHIPKGTEDKMFSEIYRILKPGGRLYLSTPHKSFWSNILDPAWYFGHRHYSKKELMRFSVNAKFNVKDSSTKAGILTLVSVLNMYISKWIFRRSPILEKFFLKIENIDYLRSGYVNIFIKMKK